MDSAEEKNAMDEEKNGDEESFIVSQGDYLKFSVIEMKFFRKFGLSEQEELLSCWDCRLDLYVPRNGKLFLSHHGSQGGHICFSSCKLNKSNVKRCIPLVEVINMEKKEATITNLKYYGVRGICFHFSDGTLLQFSRFEDRDSVWDTIKEEWERSRALCDADKLKHQQPQQQPPPMLQQQQQTQDEETNRKKKKKKKEVVCTNPPVKKKKQKKKEAVPSASSSGLLIFTVLEARGLPHAYMSGVGFVEPCCTITFGLQIFQTEGAGRNRGACKWNEKFNIAVYSYEEARALELTIDDGENRIIGTYQASIADFLEPLVPIDKWIILETERSKGFYFDGQSQFQVHIKSEFKAKEEIQHTFWKECVSVFDSDGDGKVNLTEAMSMLKVLGCSLPEDEINELYHVIDVNNDGIISADDLIRFTASRSGDLLSLLVKRCPLCGYHLSTIDEEVIYHLGVCVFDDISSFKNMLLRMMVLPLGSVLRISKKMKKGKKAPSFLVVDRQTGKLIPEIIPQRVRVLMRTVYGNKLGKKVMLTNKAIRLLERSSINQGMKFDHPSSVKDIDLFIRYYKIDTNELADPIESFACFNDFFYRKLREGARPIASPDDPEVCVAAADARLMVFNNVSEATRLWIKGKNFSIENLLDDEQLAETFSGGSIAVYRLAPQDYHRFHMPVDGRIGPSRNIAGNYHTVNPLAINSQVLNVLTENKRTITLIESPQFGTVAYIAIGATLVGSIIFTCKEGDMLKRGDEVGYFAFGGSTIITLFTKGVVKFDEDLLLNTSQPLETLVRMGERVGRKRRPDERGRLDIIYHDDQGILSPLEGDESDIWGGEDEEVINLGQAKYSLARSPSPDEILRSSNGTEANKKNFATKTKNTFKLISPMKFKGKKNLREDLAGDLAASTAAETVGTSAAASPSGNDPSPSSRKKEKLRESDAKRPIQNKKGSRIWRRRDEIKHQDSTKREHDKLELAVPSPYSPSVSFPELESQLCSSSPIMPTYRRSLAPPSTSRMSVLVPSPPVSPRSSLSLCPLSTPTGSPLSSPRSRPLFTSVSSDTDPLASFIPPSPYSLSPSIHSAGNNDHSVQDGFEVYVAASIPRQEEIDVFNVSMAQVLERIMFDHQMSRPLHPETTLPAKVSENGSTLAKLKGKEVNCDKPKTNILRWRAPAKENGFRRSRTASVPAMTESQNDMDVKRARDDQHQRTHHVSGMHHSDGSEEKKHGKSHTSLPQEAGSLSLRRGVVKQIYPPPGHPSLYQGGIDLGDCFDEDFEGDGDDPFSELHCD